MERYKHKGKTKEMWPDIVCLSQADHLSQGTAHDELKDGGR